MSTQIIYTTGAGNNWNQRPVHCAAMAGSIDIVKYLVLELKCPTSKWTVSL